jgi:hypothetical protein
VAGKGLSLWRRVLFAVRCTSTSGFLETHYARGQRGLSSQKILLYLDRFLIDELKRGKRSAES